MFYKNNSFVAKTFYGVTFQPGEIKDVPGYVNDRDFMRVARPVKQEPPKQVEVIAKESIPVKSVDPEPVAEPTVVEMPVEPVTSSTEDKPAEEVQEKQTRRRRKSADTAEVTEDTTIKEDM
jgi:hypothetical protein